MPAGGTGSSRARFLFREEAGTIEAATWRFHAAWLAALAAVLTLVWWALRPYAHHDLATQAFLAPMTIVAYAYLIAYAFALILLAICYVMLTMKRFRALGAPAGLAGLVPLLALFAASAHFLRAQTLSCAVFSGIRCCSAVTAAGGLAGSKVFSRCAFGSASTGAGPVLGLSCFMLSSDVWPAMLALP